MIILSMYFVKAQYLGNMITWDFQLPFKKNNKLHKTRTKLKKAEGKWR